MALLSFIDKEMKTFKYKMIELRGYRAGITIIVQKL